MLSFKLGVKIFGIREETVVALVTIESVFRDEELDCIVTSVSEKAVHSRTSLHFAGFAIDLRTIAFEHMTQTQAEWITARLKEALTDEFDVILEKDHIHVEFQPKGS